LFLFSPLICFVFAASVVDSVVVVAVVAVSEDVAVAEAVAVVAVAVSVGGTVIVDCHYRCGVCDCYGGCEYCGGCGCCCLVSLAGFVDKDSSGDNIIDNYSDI
jgi:hypothetical protein